jgi:hypothetical protein
MQQGIVTGVGSLPYLEPTRALELIWGTVPQAPHWAQLPMSGTEEGFSNQYLQALIELGLVTGDEAPYFDLDHPKWLDRVTEFYEIYIAAIEGDGKALDRFAFPRTAAKGFYAFIEDLKQHGTREARFLKGQLSGPLTVGFQLTSPDRRACYYDPQLKDILLKNLALHAIWQVRTLKSFGLPVIMVVDDPGLYAYGMSTHVTLNREEIISDLNSVFAGIKEEQALVGTHVCAATDWTLLFDTDVDIINFDAYEYFESMKVYSGQLAGFLARGGTLSWGLVPTSQKVLSESPESLLLRFQQYLAVLEGRGVAPSLILKQSMFTPSCGTGTLSIELAERIYRTLAELGRLIEKL